MVLPMSLDANKQLVRDFLDHYAYGRYDAALALLAPDSRWWLPGHPQEFPAAGWVDKAAVERRLFLFVVREGRIHAVKEYLDTLHALSALTGARQAAQSPRG